MGSVRKGLGIVSILLAVLVIFASGWITGRFAFGSVVDPASLSDAERTFAESMRNVVLAGSFTMATRPDAAPRPDRYEIASVEKVGNDLWRFNAVMHCCGVDGAVPIVIPMRFVGDTPMIMMTDTSLPGMGTFTVRLFFYGDRYSGTWQHGDAGGQMSGRIEKKSAASN